jgi:hypothetical protein
LLVPFSVQDFVCIALFGIATTYFPALIKAAYVRMLLVCAPACSPVLTTLPVASGLPQWSVWMGRYRSQRLPLELVLLLARVRCLSYGLFDYGFCDAPLTVSPPLLLRCCFVGVWINAHECGHQAFSTSKVCAGYLCLCCFCFIS